MEMNTNVQKYYLSGLDQVYLWWLFSEVQNITTIYKLNYSNTKQTYLQASKLLKTHVHIFTWSQKDI